MSSRLLTVCALGALTTTALPAWAECPVGATESSTISQYVTEGDTAFINMDEDGFKQAHEAAVWALPCVGEGLSSGQVAGFHKMEALGAFLGRQHGATVASFRALSATAPGYALSDDLAPESHPMRIHFAVASDMPKSPVKSLPRPNEGWIYVDGAPATEVPTDRPYVFQRFDEEGAVVQTQLVQPGLDAPRYPNKGKVKSSGGKSSGFHLNVPLAATAGVTTAAAIGFHFAAKANAKTFWDPSTPISDLPQVRQQTNTLGTLSLISGITAFGTGGAAVIVGMW